MNRFFKLCFFSGLICLLITGCEQKTPPETKKPKAEAPPATESSRQSPANPHQMMGDSQQMGSGTHQMDTKQDVPKPPKQVVVPDAVKQKWKTLSILVTDKTSGKSVSYEVKPNSEFEVPGTDLKLDIGAFLPDFSMDGQQITSASANPNNPALQVSIKEQGQEKYSGWLFSKFANMHAFEHEKYSIVLENKF